MSDGAYSDGTGTAKPGDPPRPTHDEAEPEAERWRQAFCECGRPVGEPAGNCLAPRGGDHAKVHDESVMRVSDHEAALTQERQRAEEAERQRDELHELAHAPEGCRPPWKELCEDAERQLHEARTQLERLEELRFYVDGLAANMEREAAETDDNRHAAIYGAIGRALRAGLRVATQPTSPNEQSLADTEAELTEYRRP